MKKYFIGIIILSVLCLGAKKFVRDYSLYLLNPEITDPNWVKLYGNDSESKLHYTIAVLARNDRIYNQFLSQLNTRIEILERQIVLIKSNDPCDINYKLK